MQQISEWLSQWPETWLYAAGGFLAAFFLQIAWKIARAGSKKAIKVVHDEHGDVEISRKAIEDLVCRTGRSFPEVGRFTCRVKPTGRGMVLLCHASLKRSFSTLTELWKQLEEALSEAVRDQLGDQRPLKIKLTIDQMADPDAGTPRRKLIPASSNQEEPKANDLPEEAQSDLDFPDTPENGKK